ncbi:DFP2-like protein [Mya arenaria]|uniref:DFP2-like protein n=1 Tax=Mya arenaria TaxID=6604 RepID=A0ABY7F9W4_MYAAR|nr:DFP2-like protein [Mya arenaria]
MEISMVPNKVTITLDTIREKGEMIAVFLLAALLPHIRLGTAYSTGAPSGQCDRMIPGHGVRPQMGPAPYIIKFSQPTFGCPEDNITVTLSGAGAGGATFRGFLCETRPNPDLFYTSGVINLPPNSNETHDLCGEGRSITHKQGRVDKTSISFSWTPTVAQPVYIVCTVVAKYNLFWVKLRSNPITFMERACGQQTPPSGGGGQQRPTTTPAADDNSNTASSNTGNSNIGGSNTGTDTGSGSGTSAPDNNSSVMTTVANTNENTGNTGNNASNSASTGTLPPNTTPVGRGSSVAPVLGGMDGVK